MFIITYIFLVIGRNLRILKKSNFPYFIKYIIIYHNNVKQLVTVNTGWKLNPHNLTNCCCDFRGDEKIEFFSILFFIISMLHRYMII